MKTIYQRNLPHIQSPEANYFVTYRLADSIPMEILRQLKELNVRKHENEFAVDIKFSDHDFYRKNFAAFDNFLDDDPNGPYWLQQPEIAKEVYDSLLHLNNTKIKLCCFTIMSNHVHSLFSVRNLNEDLFKIMQSHKSFTAKKCNCILGRKGRFWETESFDHIVRTNEMESTVNYILQNPVKAGLVEKWEDWPWTYLS